MARVPVVVLKPVLVAGSETEFLFFKLFWQNTLL